MGPVSVPSLDNVLFTAFFTLPAIARHPATFAELDAFFLGRNEWWEIFAGAATRRGLTSQQFERIERLAEDELIPRISTSARLSETRKADLIGRVRHAVAYCRALDHTTAGTSGAWGWKEPNSSVLLPQIVRRFPELKYVHVIRHGLDMAYSGNDNQIMSWGHLFNIETRNAPDPNSRLEFWVRSNERTISYGTTALKNNFALVSFDALVSNPEVEIPRLCKFLGVAVADENLETLCAIPAVPSSFHRYREHDLSRLDSGLLGKVREFGFDITDSRGPHAHADRREAPMPRTATRG